MRRGTTSSAHTAWCDTGAAQGVPTRASFIREETYPEEHAGTHCETRGTASTFHLHGTCLCTGMHCARWEELGTARLCAMRMKALAHLKEKSSEKLPVAPAKEDVVPKQLFTPGACTSKQVILPEPQWEMVLPSYSWIESPRAVLMLEGKLPLPRQTSSH